MTNGRLTANQRPVNGQSTVNQRPINGQSTVNQRSVNGQSTVSQGPFNGKSTANRRPVNGQSADSPVFLDKIGNLRKARLRDGTVVVFLDLANTNPFSCGGVFRETTAFINLTPTSFCHLARWTIQALDGSIITITFSFMHLFNNYEDESIEVVLHY